LRGRDHGNPCFILSREYAPPLPYRRLMGTLIGADLLNLDKITVLALRSLDGGAGTSTHFSHRHSCLLLAVSPHHRSTTGVVI